MSVNYDRPPFEDKELIICLVCHGEDDTCPNCDGTGIEMAHRAEARWDKEQKRYDDFHDKFTRE